MNGCACGKRIRVYLLSEETLATLLPESFTVDENLMKDTALYDLEHSCVGPIALHLVFFLARDWERYAPLIELWVQYVNLVAVITIVVIERHGD